MKNSSAYIIGSSIIISFTILGLFLMVALKKDSHINVNNNDYRYELVPANESNVIIFDKRTGEYWNKFMPVGEGPTEWEKGDSPVNVGE
ncbi:hypothetical protein ACWV26_07730 [Rummeliibacillus sp. JY-2-4R]